MDGKDLLVIGAVFGVAVVGFYTLNKAKIPPPPPPSQGTSPIFGSPPPSPISEPPKSPISSMLPKVTQLQIGYKIS